MRRWLRTRSGLSCYRQLCWSRWQTKLAVGAGLAATVTVVLAGEGVPPAPVQVSV